MAVTARDNGCELQAGFIRELAAFEARLGRDATLRDVVPNLEEIFASTVMVQSALLPDDSARGDVIMACYDRDQRRAYGFCISNDTRSLPPGAEPWTLYPVTNWTASEPDVDSVLGRTCDVTSPTSFDVEIDGLALMEAQRAVRWSPHQAIPVGHYGAGAVRLTTVNANGIATRVVHEWPDRIGEPVQP